MMKVSRFKKSQRILTFFVNNFNYREPYQVLIDATFCQAALQNKVVVEEQLQKYFQSQPKLLTTQCIILEAESLGQRLTGATTIVKRFNVHKCGHEGKPVSAAECIKSMTKESRYIVATQDRALQLRLRKIPGRCLLYLHKSTPVLEAPSGASKKYVMKKSRQLLPSNVEKQIQGLKELHGLASETAVTSVKKKHKRPKNPNPLSCKKSKREKRTDKNSTEITTKCTTSVKPKRKRIKLPKHLKEILQKSGSNK